MSPELLSLIVLAVIFALGTALPVNLGALAFAAAYLVGTLAGGLSTDDIFGGFPSSLFILLVGVTYLFAIASHNGTVTWITDQGVRLVGGYVAAIPWLMFALTAIVAGIGALSAASVAVVAPIALRFAARYAISPLLMGIMVVQGATAGSFSPISPFGVITNDLLDSRHLPTSPGLLFFNSLWFNAAVALVVFAVLGGVPLLRRGRLSAAELHAGTPSSATPAESERERQHQETRRPAISEDPMRHARLDVARVATLVAIVGFIIGALGFGVDVGFAAIIAAVALALFAPKRHAEAVGKIPWNVILLISGILTYIGVLEQMGTIKYLGDLLAGGGNDYLIALAAAYIGGVVSSFASTAGVLGASIPLAAPVLAHTALPAIGVVSSVGIASAIVDASPMSTNGALLLANQQGMDERSFFRRLMLWAVFVTAVMPLLSWLIFVVLRVP